MIAIGECVHSLVLGPLVADLAPPHLLGRYISVFSLMVTGGFAIGPAIGGAVLAYSPAVTTRNEAVRGLSWGSCAWIVERGSHRSLRDRFDPRRE